MALIIAIIYYVVLLLLMGIFVAPKVKNMKDFALGGGKLSWPLVTFGLTLIPLGSGHTMSLWEASTGLGASVLWWPIIVGGIMLPLAMLFFGPWLREIGVETFPEVLAKQYGRTMRYLHAAANTATWTGIAMAETMATAGAIYGLAGGELPYNPHCIIFASVLIVLYVIFAGVLQVAWMNTINATVMILGSYLALFFVGDWLAANIGGWQAISDHYMKIGEVWKLTVFKSSSDLIWQVVLPVAILHISSACVTQAFYQPMLSARSDADCRKGVFLGAFVNGISSFPWVIMALVGMAIPAIAAAGGKLVTIKLALDTLPAPIVGLLMVCLLAATLSTSSGVILGNANVIVNDIIKDAMWPKMSDNARYKMMRPMIIVCALMAFIPALVAPIIFPVFLWCFSFGIPVFLMFLIGMIWKRSRPAAWITILFTYLVNFIWTFWTPSWAPGPFALNIYPVTVCSIVLGVVLTGVLPGKIGLLKEHRAQNPVAAQVGNIPNKIERTFYSGGYCMWAVKIFFQEFCSVIILAAIWYGIWRLLNPGKKW